MKKVSSYEEFLASFNESKAEVKIIKFKDLKIEDGVEKNGETILNLPTGTDAMRKISTREKEYAGPHLEDYKKDMMKKFHGIEKATVTIDPSAVWFNQVQIDWPALKKDTDQYVKGKASYMDAFRGR